MSERVSKLPVRVCAPNIACSSCNLRGLCLPLMMRDDINAIDSEPAVARPIWSSPTAA